MREIVESIADLVGGYLWVVTTTDYVGPPVHQDTLLSTQELLSHTAKIQQTIDGFVVGQPSEGPDLASVEQLVQLEKFPELPATIAIEAVGSTFFEVFSKAPAIIDRIKATFRDVRDHDPRSYF
ncbi:MAG TPA: hypothetical protein VHY91_24215 [Pirellulales bacterium]|nr:hypothetical protein [Pirellulales bacterium]